MRKLISKTCNTHQQVCVTVAGGQTVVQEHLVVRCLQYIKYKKHYIKMLNNVGDYCVTPRNKM